MSLLGRTLDVATGLTYRALDYMTQGLLTGAIQASGKTPGASGGTRWGKSVLSKDQAEFKVENVLRRVEGGQLVPAEPTITPTSTPGWSAPPDYIPVDDYGTGGDAMPFGLPQIPLGFGGTPGYTGLPGVGSTSTAGAPWWQTLIGDVIQGGIQYLTQPRSQQPAPLPPVNTTYGPISGPAWDPISNVFQPLGFYGQTPGATGIPSGYHLDKKTRSRLVRNRHTNYANGRAAMRAIRRLRGTRKMLAKIERMMPHRKCAPRPRRRR